MRTTTSLLLLIVLCGPLASADEVFHVYAPSRTTSKLLIVTATPTAEGLKLLVAALRNLRLTRRFSFSRSRPPKERATRQR